MPAKPPVKTPGTSMSFLTVIKSFATDPRLVPMLNYFLLFCMVMTLGLSGIVVLLIANFRQDKGPDWLQGHYIFQARTFWIAIAPILLTFFLGVFAAKHGYANLPWVHYSILGLMLVCLAWTAGRAVLGFNHLFYNRPIPNPRAFMI